MSANRIRYFTVVIPLPGTLGAGEEVGGYEVQTRCRLLEAELFLSTTGTTSGNTDVEVRLGTSTDLLTSPGLRIAYGATTKRVRAIPAAAAGEPSGVDLAKGDYISIDIDAVPGVASTNGVVTLLMAANDV